MKSTPKRILGFVLTRSLLIVPCLLLVNSMSANSITTIEVPVTEPWYDTGLDLAANQTVTISASGDAWNSDARVTPLTPAGDPSAITGPDFYDLTDWSLIGEVGSSGDPFEIGDSATFDSLGGGELYLEMDDNFFSDNSGDWNVTISSTPVPDETSTFAMLTIALIVLGVWTVRGRDSCDTVMVYLRRTILTPLSVKTS
jgi:hypothetical protein